MTGTRPNSMRKLDNVIRRMTADDKAYVDVRSLMANAIVGHNEIGDVDEPDYVVPAEANSYLTRLGFPEVGPIARMPLHHQIAQKLHGASEPGSKRVHDLIDLQIIDNAGNVDWTRTRQACERLFAYRKMQAWPPTIVIEDAWGALYDGQRGSLDVAESAAEAVEWANALIARIVSSD